MQNHGWIPITVPGAPKAWAPLSAHFGKLPFAKLLEPAVQYAQEGNPISPILRNHGGIQLKIGRIVCKERSLKLFLRHSRLKGKHHELVKYGVMGGYMQPQGHLQVIVNTVDF